MNDLARLGSWARWSALAFALAASTLVGVAGAQVSEGHRECAQRGYEVVGSECVFPDGTRCALAAFAAGSCGAEFKTEDYCVEEGKQVWDEDKCCKGLVAKEGEGGELRCQKRSLLGRLIRRPLFWVLLVATTLSIEMLMVRRRLRKLREDD